MAFGIPMWITIALVVIIVLAILFRTMNQVYLLSILKNNFFYFFIILIIAFVAYSMIKIHSSNNFDYKTTEGWKGVGRVYYFWFTNIVGNLVKTTGYAINQNWVVTNSTSGK